MSADLSWLVGRRCTRIQCDEFSWTFAFDTGEVRTPCLWRLVESGRIRVTSEDHGHQFGLPAPLDAVTPLSRLLALAPLNLRRCALIRVISSWSLRAEWYSNSCRPPVVTRPGSWPLPTVTASSQRAAGSSASGETGECRK